MTLIERLVANVAERAQLLAIALVEDEIARLKRIAIAHGIPAEELERIDHEAREEALR